MRSPSDFSFVAILGREASEERAEVRELWTKFAGLDQAEAARRQDEILMVVREKSGKIVGVSTAPKIRVKILNDNWFYQFRYFIHPQFRLAGLDMKLTKESVNCLEALEVSDKPIGVLAVIQNAAMENSTTLKRAVLLNVPFVFIGNTAEGYQTRVYYFKNARI